VSDLDPLDFPTPSLVEAFNLFIHNLKAGITRATEGVTMPITVPDNWSFDAPTIAEGFDDHVREQLPFYELATAAVVDLARLHLPADGVLVDLGEWERATDERLARRRAGEGS